LVPAEELMRLKGYFFGVFLATAIAAFLVLATQPGKLHGQNSLRGVRTAKNLRLASLAPTGSRPRMACEGDGNCAARFSLPMTLEANDGQASSQVKFIARGNGITALLTEEGIDVVVGSERKGTESRIVKLRFEREVATPEPISQSGESTTEKTKRSRRASSAAPGKTHSRRKSKSGSATGVARHRRSRKKSARPRTRRKRAADDSAPTQRQVPNQNAPVIPTAPREKNPPSADGGILRWRGDGKLAGETNYFLGNDPAKWRTHVPHFSRAVAKGVLPGVDVVTYGNERALEYDLRVAPGVDARSLRLRISGADEMKLDADGDLLIVVAGQEIRMKKPAMYEETTGEKLSKGDSGNLKLHRRPVEGGYAIEADGSVSFRIATQDVAARLDTAELSTRGSKNVRGAGTLVIDPTLSVSYSTFLGGTGSDSATSVTVDSCGTVYVSGTTTSAGTFSESSKKLGPDGGASDYFIAKIEPSTFPECGFNPPGYSLAYLTFIGGSNGDEEGGFLAVDSDGNAAIAGTTTSTDFPVTDGSTRTTGTNATNDATITGIDKSGALVFSTLFGGNGAEATQGPGGIAIDSSRNVYVAMDTSSTNLPPTTTPPGAFQPFQPVYGGGISDGFLAVFAPPSTPGKPATLIYFTYLGLSAQASVAGVAVDSQGNAFLAGFTSNPNGTLNTMNGFQTTYVGGAFDGFVMKIVTPAMTGAGGLSYGTFLGGTGSDKALAIAVGTDLPATAYVTGSTQSTDFPTSVSVAPLQTKLNGTANAFLSVISQNPTTGMTSQAGVTTLAYSSYLGGSGTDAGQSIWFGAVNQGDEVYVVGTTTSWDFPWHDNFQPFNGDSDAFVTAMVDPISTGAASIVYTTPLGGTAPVGVTAGSSGNAVTVDPSGNVYVVGATTTADFPRAGNPGTGIQPICASCQLSPPENDAFVVKIAANSMANPSVSFNPGGVSANFGSQPVGMPNNVQVGVAIMNTGDQPLTISSISITGANSGDFSAVDPAPCLASISPGLSCGFEMQFNPSVVGPEGAFLTLTDNAPGNPHVLALVGIGAGPLALLSPSSINFGSVPVGTTPSQGITLTNTGAGTPTLQISSIGVSGNNVSEFPLSADTCPTSLAPGVSCGFSITFTPSAVGTFTAALNVTDNSGIISNAVQTVSFTGTATAAAPLLNISPTALTFAAQAVGSTSGNQAVTVANQGSGTLNISAIGVTGSGASSFGIVPAGSNPCPSSGTLASSASCTVTINFTPLSGGTKSASLSLTDNASGSPQTIFLTGTAVAPAITLSASSLTFSAQPAGTASTPQNATLSNPGTSSLGISGIVLTGANPTDFIETNNCPQSLGASASCLITVKFDPAASGSASRTASISVSDNAPQSPQTIALTGSVTVATVSVSPSTISFGSQLAGATPGAPVAVTVKNTGTGALTVSGASVTDATDFTMKNNCTAAIPAGGTCTVSMTFAPAAPASGAQCGSTTGSKSATLTLTDNATDSPQAVMLTGTATDFCPNPPTVGGNSLTVTKSATATFQLDITSMNGFSGSVGIACTGAVPGAGSCATSASTLNVPANGQAPFTVSVPTASSVVRPRAREFRWPPWNWYLAVIALATMLGMATLGHRFAQASATLRENRKLGAVSYFYGKKIMRIAQASLLLLIFGFAMSACSGGPGPAATQSNAYSFTVTATAGGATRTIALTLTVQ
jgi:Abnormal spindle-like microcephaly-assoc'd, ASPM-SPD-2-Hydin/Beta-propeller repeat